MENKIKNLRKNLNENDLLKQQTEFLRESKDPEFKPTVDKLYKSEQVIKDQEIKTTKYDEPSLTNVFMPLNIIERDTSNVTVNEIEKNINESMQLNDQNLKAVDLTNLINFKNNSNNGKKKSLFSQYMESKRQKKESEIVTKSNDQIGNGLIDCSGLFKDKKLAKKEAESISEENENLLSKLNDNEKLKLAEQFNISNLDPNLLKFIKSRKSKSNELNQPKKEFKKDYVSLNSASTVLKHNSEEDKQKDDKLSTFTNPYISEEEIKKNRWLNMDKVEKEKLEWIKPLVENEKKVKSNSSIEGKAARFNFEGDLILKEEQNYHLGLHHHSEQDTAAGYTINELIDLTQSRFTPQRILALNTLANIFKRMHRGYFDICFDKSLTIELIEQTEILILLRRLLDDSNTSLQLVTIKCIHSLICNTLYDEFCLDRLFCSMELGIEIPKLCYNDLDNEKEYKDEQLCKLDVISCLIRMNILSRLRYLLDNLILKKSDSIDPIVVDNVLDILIRICRHSQRSCKQLIETPYLMECLINNFISPKSNILNWKVLKIIRILFTTDKQFIIKLKKDFPSLWITIRNYLITNPLNEDNKEVYSTIIEVLRIWRVLLIIDNELNDTTEQFIELASNIRNCLNIKILINNSFDLHYISNLLHCLAYVIQKSPSLEHFFTPLIQDLTFQWFREIVNNNELPKLDGCLAVSSALLYLSWSSTTKDQLFDYALKPILNNSNLLIKITDQLVLNSSILNFKEYHNSIYRDSKALPSYGSIYFGGSTIKLNQLLNEDSVIFLIGSLIGLTSKHKLSDCLEQFIYNPKVRSYLDRIAKQKSSNWSIFELIEFNPISQLILWEKSVLNKNEYFDHALAIISSVGDVQLKQSLYEYIFDVKQYKQNYDEINELNGCKDDSNQITDQLIKSSISFFNEIKKVYSTFSSFEESNWLFDPLIKLYKIQLDPECQIIEDEMVGYLISCLNYLILIYNFKPKYLWSLIEPKILFIYLTSIFLFKNGLFLNEELLKILRYFLIDLTKNYHIIFDCYEEKIPEPFNSIGDHFTALCLNYKTDSYGNHIFNNYLLCFLTQRSDKIFRKKMLDEHSACLNYFILNKDQLLIDFNHLIRPIENDLRIIESYLRVLMAKDISKERNPLIYEIACIHVSANLFNDQYHENRLQNLELSNKLITCLKRSTNKQLKEHLKVADN